MSVRMIQITEIEARMILSWCTRAGQAGLEPTSIELDLDAKMRVVLSSFENERTLTPEEAEIIRLHRHDRVTP